MEKPERDESPRHYATPYMIPNSEDADFETELISKTNAINAGSLHKGPQE